jgi:hypothetical protein
MPGLTFLGHLEAIHQTATPSKLEFKTYQFWIIISAEMVLLLMISLSVRLIGIGEGALHDELYHFLAARGFLEHGEFTISPGAAPYNRAALFTKMVAAFMATFTPTLVVARIPALLAGSLLPIVAFLWLRLNGDRFAGWVIGILVAMDPLLIQLSQIVRFYTFQHLAFLMGTIGVSLLFRPYSFLPKTIILILAAATYWIALNLQPVSIMGLGGVIIFAAGAIWWKKVRRLNRKARLWVHVIAVSFSLIAGTFIYANGMASKYIEMMSYADLWASLDVKNYRFYYALLISHYAPFWSMFPILMLLSFVRLPKITLLCATIFTVGFIGLSLAAWKSERYFSYLLPFFLIIVGVGGVSGLKLINTYIGDLISKSTFAANKGSFLLKSLIISVISGSAIIGNHAYLSTARLLTREHSFSFPLMGARDGSLSWSLAATILKPIVNDVDVVVTSDDLKALYYLGRAEYVLSPNSLHTGTGILPEFSKDRLSNAVIVASTSSVEEIHNCYKNGLFIVQAISLGQSPTKLPRLSAAKYFAEKGELIDLPEKYGLIAYRWRTELDISNDACPNVILYK